MCGLSQAWAVCCRWLVLLITICGIVLSLLAGSSCYFMQFLDENGNINGSGMFRYKAPGESCQKYDENRVYDGAENTARFGAVAAPLAAAGALTLILIEFACCRFPCSRVLMSLLYVAAFTSQALTFLLFFSGTYWYVLS
mmetsp:Transcript_14571/g.22188  ORF Transcript_14571/g.22188 Transcript_14571/m.22188 type:complete len:140 (+) Transcript_14571:41-460(+)